MKRSALLLLTLTGCILPHREPAPLSKLIDAVLGPRQNDGYAGVIMGPVGDRLWAQGVRPAPGLQGTFQYIHNPGLPGSLFALELLEDDRPITFPPLVHQWWPSHIGMEGRADGLQLVERKFITHDDRGCDLVRLFNESKDPRHLTLRIRTPLAVDESMRGKMKLFDIGFSYALAATRFAPAVGKISAHAALNPDRGPSVTPRASFTWSGDSVWAPLRGEHQVENRWTCWSSKKPTDWYEVEFAEAREVNRVVLDLFDDGAGVWAPKEVLLEADGGTIAGTRRAGSKGLNEFVFESVRTKKLRVNFTHQPGRYSGIVALEVYPMIEREVRLLERVVDLAPGESVTFAIEMAFNGEPRVDADVSKLFEKHLGEYNGWFERNIPDFECSDAWMTKLWYYRWYVVRHCLADPKAGLLTEPCFFEGRHMDWYPRVITYGHALQCEEARWLRDPKYAYGHCRAVFANQYEGKDGFFEGQFPNVQVDRRINHYYTEWIATEPWRIHLVHPDRESLKWSLPRMKRTIDGLLSRFDTKGNLLLQVVSQDPGGRDGHFHTGMEFQPSFFWFNESKVDTSRETWVERVDFTTYLFAEFEALASAFREAGSGPPTITNEATWAEDFAERVRSSVLSKMWDADRKFFYSTHPESRQKAEVEEIVGFYPFAFRLVPVGNPRYSAAFDRLFDPEQFWAPYPARSASKRAEFYSQDRPNACHWNGPTWPFANSLIVEALANAIKIYNYPNVTRRRFYDFLMRFTRAQFENGDFTKPLVGEFYNSETGAWQTPTKDYFHSTYCDLLIRHVGGLTPRADETLEFFPVVDALPHFRFRNIPYHGTLLDIIWVDPASKDVYGEGRGFTVKRNGKVLFTRPTLEHVLWPTK